MTSDDVAASKAASSGVQVGGKERDWVAYGAWLSRPPTPGVEVGTYVILPATLGHAHGKVVWDSGNGLEWAVLVKYTMNDGTPALVYIHKADVRVAEWQADD